MRDKMASPAGGSPVSRHFAALPALLLALPLAPGAPRPKEKERPPSYFPVQVGFKGVYDEGRFETTWEVAAVEEKDGETVVTIHQISADGKTEPYEKVSVSAKGLYRLEVFKFRVDPYCFLRFPVKKADSWEYDVAGQAGLRGVKGTMTVGPVEEVEVPAGKFKAVRVDMVVTRANDAALAQPERGTVWYDPEVGLVKLTSDQGFTRVLKSFTRPEKK
jgi:hypothetical protein